MATKFRRSLPYIVFFTMMLDRVAPMSGTVVHALDVKAMVESSDLVVIGTVEQVNERGRGYIEMPSGPLAGRQLVARIAIDEVLKGTASTTDLQIEFVLPDSPAGVHGIPPKRYGIFFLRDGATNYTVLDPVYPFLPAVPGGKVLTGAPLDRVVAKLVEVLTLNHASEPDVSSALNALVTIPGKPATDALRTAFTVSSGELQLRIAAKLTARNDITGLDLVERTLMHGVQPNGYLFRDLAGSLGGLRDPKSVPALRRLLTTNNPDIQIAAAMALRQTGSSDALEPLSQLLNNSSELVRYYAVAGMGEITRQDEWTPAFEEFRSREAYYVSYWRQWASANLSSQ